VLQHEPPDHADASKKAAIPRIMRADRESPLEVAAISENGEHEMTL
jgi:hypothetical protein